MALNMDEAFDASNLEKAVVTDSSTPLADNPWHDTTTVVRR